MTSFRDSIAAGYIWKNKDETFSYNTVNIQYLEHWYFKVPPMFQRTWFGHILIFFNFYSGYLKLLIVHSKFSGSRKFTLRFQ